MNGEAWGIDSLWFLTEQFNFQQSEMKSTEEKQYSIPEEQKKWALKFQGIW